MSGKFISCPLINLITRVLRLKTIIAMEIIETMDFSFLTLDNVFNF